MPRKTITEEQKEEKRKYNREWIKQHPESVKKAKDKYRSKETNKVKEKEQYKKYYEKNRDKVKNKCINYYYSNKEELRKYRKKYYDLNKENIQEYSREYYKNNLDKINDYKRKNKEKIRKIQLKWNNNQYKTNLIYKTKALLRSSFKRFTLNISAFEYVNYSAEQLKNYLLTTLPDNFSEQDWLNGKFHIDHIIPMSLYNVFNEKDIENCFNLRNLRLLESSKNLSKKNKLDFELIEKMDIFDLLPIQCFLL